MQLENFNFIKNLEPDEQQFLKSVLKPVTIPERSIIFFQGDQCEDILLIGSGKIKVYLHSNGSDTVTLYHLTSGEQCIVNTSSAISSSPSIATAESITEVQGWLLPRKHAKELMLRSETYQNFIFSLFTIKLSSLAEIIEDIKFTTLEDRLMKRFKKNPHNTFTTTHEELAEELGSSRVAVSRVLKQLEQQGALKLHRGKIEMIM